MTRKIATLLILGAACTGCLVGWLPRPSASNMKIGASADTDSVEEAVLEILAQPTDEDADLPETSEESDIEVENTIIYKGTTISFDPEFFEVLYYDEDFIESKTIDPEYSVFAIIRDDIDAKTSAEHDNQDTREYYESSESGINEFDISEVKSFEYNGILVYHYEDYYSDNEDTAVSFHDFFIPLGESDCVAISVVDVTTTIEELTLDEERAKDILNQIYVEYE